jgi:hypothetical protein
LQRHDTQHLNKHLREQLHSQLTSVTCENSASDVQMKRAENDKSMTRPQRVNIKFLVSKVSDVFVSCSEDCP